MDETNRRKIKHIDGWVLHKSSKRNIWNTYWVVILDNVIFIFTDSDAKPINMYGTLKINNNTEVFSINCAEDNEIILKTRVSNVEKKNHFKFKTVHERSMWTEIIIKLSKDPSFKETVVFDSTFLIDIKKTTSKFNGSYDGSSASSTTSDENNHNQKLSKNYFLSKKNMNMYTNKLRAKKNFQYNDSASSTISSSRDQSLYGSIFSKSLSSWNITQESNPHVIENTIKNLEERRKKIAAKQIVKSEDVCFNKPDSIHPDPRTPKFQQRKVNLKKNLALPGLNKSNSMSNLHLVPYNQLFSPSSECNSIRSLRKI